MTEYHLVPIGKLVESPDTWNPARVDGDTAFTYIDLAAVDQTSKVIAAPRQVLASEAPSRARQVVERRDVLVSTVRPNLNAVAVVPTSLDKAIASTGFCVLRPIPNRLDSSYLFHWVKTPEFVGHMVRRATGASYPAVSDRIVRSSEIPLPPLPEQRRIGAILDQADALRAKRREVLTMLDSIDKALFVDLFGDMGTIAARWPQRALKDLGRVKTGTTPSSAAPDQFDGPIPFITPGDLESGATAKRSLTESGAKNSRTVRAGSTLVCCIGATIGKVGMARVHSAFNQQINAIDWGSDVRDSYGVAIMKFKKADIIASGSSTTMPILNKSSFERFRIPVPPLELQTRFEHDINRIDLLRSQCQSSFACLDALFASLQQRAFRGEL